MSLRNLNESFMIVLFYSGIYKQYNTYLRKVTISSKKKYWTKKTNSLLLFFFKSNDSFWNFLVLFLLPVVWHMGMRRKGREVIAPGTTFLRASHNYCIKNYSSQWKRCTIFWIAPCAQNPWNATIRYKYAKFTIK